MSTLTQTPSRHDLDRPLSIEAVDGTPLHVRGPIGDAGPPLVALHGLADSGAGYVPVLLRAAPGHRAWALDFRGHGASGHTRGGYALADYVNDAVALLEAVGEPAVVVGSGRTFAGFDPARRLQVPAVVVRSARGDVGGRERWCDDLSEFLDRHRRAQR